MKLDLLFDTTKFTKQQCTSKGFTIDPSYIFKSTFVFLSLIELPATNFLQSFSEIRLHVDLVSF